MRSQPDSHWLLPKASSCGAHGQYSIRIAVRQLPAPAPTQTTSNRRPKCAVRRWPCVGHYGQFVNCVWLPAVVGWWRKAEDRGQVVFPHRLIFRGSKVCCENALQKGIDLEARRPSSQPHSPHRRRPRGDPGRAPCATTLRRREVGHRAGAAASEAPARSRRRNRTGRASRDDICPSIQSTHPVRGKIRRASRRQR